MRVYAVFEGEKWEGSVLMKLYSTYGQALAYILDQIKEHPDMLPDVEGQCWSDGYHYIEYEIREVE